MHRQVGDLKLDKTGIAQRGLLIRHLVLPENIAGSKQTLEFIAKEISEDTYVNLMGQYRPCFQADRYAGIGRSPTRAEMAVVKEEAKQCGLHRLD
jgi:putative pyruvate formate lyase activating enzyme